MKELKTCYTASWAQLCCKMWGDSLMQNQYSHRADVEDKFCKCRFTILFLEVFFKQH